MAMKEQLDSAADECGDISLTVATELLARAAVLDQFSYALPDETSAALHEAVGWPHRIEQQAAAAMTMMRKMLQTIIPSLMGDWKIPWR